MAERFNLTAQLHLQAPRNVGQVVGQIRRQLHGISANVNVKGDARTIAKVNKELRSVDKHARSSAASVGRLNRNLSEAARRFSVITVATGTMLAFAHAVKNAVGEAISFERELVKISQVSGRSVRNLQGLTKEITRLSTSLGASSADLLSVSRTLTQAGFSAQKTKQALDILAKTSLGATFDDIKNTTEGAIAVLRQFRAEAQRTGGDIKFLEQTMDAINAVSKRFAVESNDLISVIRRVGGVFETAGGSVNELIALFTSVRATTRETAETIATGLRTIFTRIQRTETVDQLRQLGIELRNAKGQFVGSYEAVRRLSEGLAGLDPRDYRFSQIVEQLGGFRQIGKVIPMIRQFTTAQQALNVAQAASGSVTKDAITAQQSLAVQAAKVREEFSALMRHLSDSSTFRSIANGALELAKAFIKVTEAITPVLPMLTMMMGMKIGRALAPGLGAVTGVGRGRATGGKIHKFSSGGFVPGRGNTDTVPAMLQPGEFVIKKSSAQKLGAGNLHAMNKYAAGGVVTRNRGSYGRPMGVNTIARTLKMTPTEVRAGNTDALREQAVQKLQSRKAQGTQKGKDQAPQNIITSGKLTKPFGVSFLRGSTDRISATIAAVRKESNATGRKVLDAAILAAAKKKNPNNKKIKTSADAYKFVKRGAILDTSGTPTFLQSKGQKIFEDDIMSGVPRMFSEAAKSLKGELKVAHVPLKQLLSTSAIGSIEGQFFEAFVRRVTDNVIKDTGPDAIFDFKNMPGTQKDIKKLFGRKSFVLPNEFKNDANSSNMASAIGKALTLRKSPEFFNKGGAVDSVPAMLTPGEYVINRSSAQAIGYSNLNKMNKTGVQHFARGGVVQNFARGGMVPVQHFLTGGKSLAVGPGLPQDFMSFDAGGELKKLGGAASSAIQGLQGMANGMQSFIFLGGAVTAVTAQMSGLSESTKQAINETAGFAVALVGMTGTVLQTIAGMAASATTGAASIATEQVKQKENIESSLTEEAKQQANLKSAASENARAATGARLGGAMKGFLLGVTAALVALKYFSASNRALADENQKKWKSALDKIGKEGGGDAGAIQASVKAEMAARQKSTAQFNKGTVGIVAGMSAAAAAGALWGTSLGPLGTAIGAVAGAAAGLGISMWKANKEVDNAAVARQREAKAVMASIEGFIKLTNAQKTLEDAFADIDAAGLSPEREVQLKLSRLGESGRADTVGQGREAEARIAEMAKRFGVTSAEVRATGGKEGELRKLAGKAGIKGAKGRELAATNAGPLQIAMKQLEAANSLAASRAKLSAQVYAKAADGLRGASNFGELRKALPAFQAAMNARTKAIQESAALELDAARRAVSDAKSDPEKAEAVKNVKKIQSALANRLKLQREADKKLVQSVRKRIKEDLLAAKAAEALRKEMVATNKFMRDLGAIAASQAKQEKRLKNEAALVENKQLDFSVAQTTGIADLTMVKDLKKFEKELRSSIRNLPPTMRAKANDMVDGVVSTAKLINVAKENMVGKGIARGATVPTADQVLKAAGLDPTKVDGDIKRGMTKSIEEAFKTDRKISAEDFDKIFEPLIKEGQAQAKALSSVQQKYNKAVSLHTQSLNNQQMVLEKRTAAELRLVEIANKNEVMMAKARGMDDAGIGKILDRQDRKTAQVSLAGTGVRAGDLGGAVKARDAAQQRREQIAKEIRSTNLSLVARKKLMTEDRKMSIVISRTTGEIKRLGDQSEKAGRLMDQIDAERAKREVLTGLVTDFVVGGQEERRAMQKSVMGIQFAMATGTLQSQSPEQRQATVGMLDTLADIQIPGAGGMTGKEVKQKLVFDDAVRMGLDPKIAKQLAKATSKEEKLITALESLTKQMELANKVEAEGKAMGGLVHLAGGGSTIFKPRGTDTVPAMLTPGEFVIKKSSVDKYGTGMMSAINAGRFAKGGVVYRQFGGGSPWRSKEYNMPPLWPGNPAGTGSHAFHDQHGSIDPYYTSRVTPSDVPGSNMGNSLGAAKMAFFPPHPYRITERDDMGNIQLFQWNRLLGGHKGSRVSREAYLANLRLQGRGLDPRIAAKHEPYRGTPFTQKMPRPDQIIGQGMKRIAKKGMGTVAGGAKKGAGWFFNKYLEPFTQRRMAERGFRDLLGPGPFGSDSKLGFTDSALRTRGFEKRIDMGQNLSEAGMAAWSKIRTREMTPAAASQSAKYSTAADVRHQQWLERRRQSDMFFNPHRYPLYRPRSVRPPTNALTASDEMRLKFQQGSQQLSNMVGRGSNVVGGAIASVGSFIRKRRKEKAAEQRRQAERDEGIKSSQRLSFGGAHSDPAPYQAGTLGVDARVARANKIADDREKEVAAIQAEQARQKPSGFMNKAQGFRSQTEETFKKVKDARARRQKLIDERMAEFYGRRQDSGKGQKYFSAENTFRANRQLRAEEKARQRRERLQMRYGRRFADGGQVDSVPAMLTPGEFVMNRGAVQRYGTGFMSSLNRGNLPGFNNGGVVGAKYFQNGSTSAVKQGGGFNFGSLAGMLDTMTKAFPTLNSVITKLQNVFSDLNMTHNFKGDMSLAFSVTNTDALKQSIADAITPHISDLITRELDNRFGGFNATGP